MLAAPASATIMASIMTVELASTKLMARFGHVAVMDAHNASCQRALLLTRLLNLGIPLYLTRFPVRLSPRQGP